ncbi:hypothetical protein [Lactococcus lactis]|uniref:hypothetical protein n=1 Tax=Lactococcus lactis TaxID=1358 RepID=UPI0035A62FA8
MTVPVVFEGGILQNDELFSFLKEVENKVPDIVNSKDDKTFLNNYKKEISATINEIDLSEKKQIDEMIEIFRDRNPQVWEIRSKLAGIVTKITQMNNDFDERRRKAGFEAVDLAVNEANVVYGLSGSRFVLTTGRFTSVDMSKRNSINDLYLKKYIHADLTETGEHRLSHAMSAKGMYPPKDYCAFTQQEIDSMQTGSYEQIEVTE